MDPLRIDDASLRAWPLPPLDGDADKESRGRVVIVAGSRQVPGAALLAAQAALRVGAGKVAVATVASAAMALALAVPELRVVALRENASGDIEPTEAEALDDCLLHAGALLIGPGLQDEAAAAALAQALCERHPCVPTVLDAAAMAAAPLLQRDGATLLVTPHAGEMAHLTGVDKASVQVDAPALARQYAKAWQAIVALKGATTLIAHPDGRLWQHDAGVAGLATAGSGDVLAGLVAGLVGRGAALEQAAAWAVALHARAGVRLGQRLGMLGFLASELAGEVPAVLGRLMQPAGLMR